MSLPEIVHLINVYHHELRESGISVAHVYPYRTEAGGWMLVNRWHDGAELLEDFDTTDALTEALSEKLARVQGLAGALRGLRGVA